MNRLQLTKFLNQAGVGNKALAFSAANDKYVVSATAEGWSVTFTERGHRTYEAHFPSEDEACRQALKLLAPGFIAPSDA
jgi:hypothetical protein